MRLVELVFGFRRLATLSSEQPSRRLHVSLSRAPGEELGSALAESFSATAVATNWLMVVPSALLIAATAAFNDVGNRNG